MAHLTIKVCTLGSSCAGKTSTLYSLMDLDYDTNMTLGVAMETFDFEDIEDNAKDYYKYWGIEGLRLVVWDTAGQERFQAIVESYMRNVGLVLLFIDASCQESIWHADRYLEKLKLHKDEFTPYILVLINKIDLEWKINLSDLSALIIKYKKVFNFIGNLRLFNMRKADGICDINKKLIKLSPWADMLIENFAWVSVKKDPEGVKDVLVLATVSLLDSISKKADLRELDGFVVKYPVEDIEVGDDKCCVLL